MFTDNSVLQIQDGYDYDRKSQSFTVAEALLVNGYIGDLAPFQLNGDYEEMVGIAIYDRSAAASGMAYSLGLKTNNGVILQEATGRKSWVFTGSGTSDISMPETHHYKIFRLAYKRIGISSLIFKVVNQSGTALTEDLVLDIVVISRRPSVGGNVAN